MVSKFAPKRANKIISENNITEPLVLINDTDDYYIAPSGNVYRKYPNGFLPRKSFINKKNGYIYITLVKSDGKKRTYRLHRLVAEAYLPNPNNLPIVGHRDNIRSNPDVSNLYWTTYSENSQKAVDEHRLINDKGYNDSQSKPVICYDNNYNEIARYGSVTECHKAIGISKSTIIRHCEHQIKTKTRNGYYFRYQNT